jgi:Family of unknown function (DUF5318)
MYRCDISFFFKNSGLFDPSRRAVGLRVVMSFGPLAQRGAGSGQAGHVDYRLTRNLIVSEFRKGRLSRLDVCDAHPELLRAAANVGDESHEDCPICEETKLRLVSYAFGPRLPPSGTCVTSRRELTKLARGRHLNCYIVEVCPKCSWNHLVRSFGVAPGRQ